jgi:hypothetical protein
MNWTHPLLWYLLGLTAGSIDTVLTWTLFNLFTKGHL